MSPTGRDEPAVHRDVVHTSLDGYRPLALDLYLPAQPRIGCLYLHGGGWRRGSRREGPGPLGPGSRRLFARLASHGIAVASVDYRLSGEARYPAQSEDVAAAVRWWREDQTYGLASLPLTAFGVSAGGQLACVAGLDPALDLRAVAAWYPVTDLVALPQDRAAVGAEPDRGPGSREALVLGGTAEELPDLATRASAALTAHAGAPPYLLLHGDDDDLVPAAQSRRLRDALTSVGGTCTYETVAGYAHMFAGMPDPEVDALLDRTARFLLGAA